MPPSLSNSKKDLLGGIKELIAGALGAKASDAPFCTKGTALALAKGDRPELDLGRLIDGMAEKIEANWIESGRQWRGKDNWRWELRTDLDEHNLSPEVRLNRKLAKKLAELDGRRWANEIPTGSGLMARVDSSTGGLDFAYRPSPERLCLIELKNGENPVSAAFQIVTYALVWNLARRVHAGVVSREEPITMAQEWVKANEADLRVLVPTDHYKPFRNLAWFEERLNDGIAAFGAKHDLCLTFGFRRFDDAPTDEVQALKALAQEVDWQ